MRAVINLVTEFILLFCRAMVVDAAPQSLGFAATVGGANPTASVVISVLRMLHRTI